MTLQPPRRAWMFVRPFLRQMSSWTDRIRRKFRREFRRVFGRCAGVPDDFLRLFLRRVWWWGD